MRNNELPGSTRRRSRRRDGKVITNRDRDVVDWIARIGAVQPEHVMFRFGMGRTVVYRRLAALESAGLIERFRLLHGQPALIVATKAGLRLCGLEHLGVTKVSAGAAAHWQASALIAAVIDRGDSRGSIGGVREIRAAQRTARQPVASATIGAASHFPDLVLWGPQGAGQPGGTVIEVELTAKAPDRLRQILNAWSSARLLEIVAAVVYVCTPEARRAVTRAIEATYTQKDIHIFDMPGLDILGRLAEQERVG
jgi:hypothetical protein